MEALAWRDQTEISLGKIRSDRHIVTVSNTSTGVVGVRHNEKLNRYEVSWVTKEGKDRVSYEFIYRGAVSKRNHRHFREVFVQ